MQKDHLPDNLGLPVDLGTFRTVMAADRTLMAWVRTALSMYSFGFTIYKFLEGAVEADAVARTGSPQKVGLFLVAMGTAAMVLGVISYWVTLSDLRRSEDFRLGRPTLFMAFLMMLGGVGLFIAILRRAV
jgi:putative membrane protein